MRSKSKPSACSRRAAARPLAARVKGAVVMPTLGRRMKRGCSTSMPRRCSRRGVAAKLAYSPKRGWVEREPGHRCHHPHVHLAGWPAGGAGGSARRCRAPAARCWDRAWKTAGRAGAAALTAAPPAAAWLRRRTGATGRLPACPPVGRCHPRSAGGAGWWPARRRPAGRAGRRRRTGCCSACSSAPGWLSSNSSAFSPCSSTSSRLGRAGATMALPSARYSNSFSGEA